jgi:dCMP deaminase
MTKNITIMLSFLSMEIQQAPLNWDEYFMLQAMMAGLRSKDPSTKVGSVFVDQYNHQVSMGYNGFVAGIDETKLSWNKDPNSPLEEQKYGYVVHAEANAILHAKANLEHTRCYVTLFPCHECAKLIASKKVREVIYLSDKHASSESTRIAKKIFDLSKISYRQLSLPSKTLGLVHHHLEYLMVRL